MLLSKGSKLSAVCWAAEKAGLSYGKFVQSLDEKQKQAIYTDYAAYMKIQNEQESAAIRNAMKTDRKPEGQQSSSEVPMLDVGIDSIYAGEEVSAFIRERNAG